MMRFTVLGILKQHLLSLRLIILASVASISMGYNLSVFNISHSALNEYFDWCSYPEYKNFGLDCKPLLCPRAIKKLAFLHGGFLVAAVFGSLVSGIMLSKLGRRISLISVLTLFGTSMFSGSFAHNYLFLVTTRFLAGLASGMATVIPGVYMIEMSPPALKTLSSFVPQIAVNFGIFLGMLMGLPLVISGENCVLDASREEDTPDIVMRSFTSETAETFHIPWWRFMVGCPVIFCIVSVLLLFYIYPLESPIYLRKSNKSSEADRVTSILMIQKKSCREDATSLYLSSSKLSEVDSSSLESPPQICEKPCIFDVHRDLSKWNKLRLLATGWVFAVAHQLTGINFFITASTSLFDSANFPRSYSIITTLLIGFIGLLCAILSAYHINKTSRRKILIGGALAMGSSFLPLIIVEVTKALSPNDTLYLIISIVSTLCFIIAFGFSYGPGLFPYLSELYPSNLKDLGLAIAFTLNWLTCFFIIMLLPFLAQEQIYKLFSAFSFLSAIFAYFFAPETVRRNIVRC